MNFNEWRNGEELDLIVVFKKGETDHVLDKILVEENQLTLNIYYATPTRFNLYHQNQHQHPHH